MTLTESTHYDLQITAVGKRVVNLLEPQLTLRFSRRDGDNWLAALNARRAARYRKHVRPVEGLFDVRACLEALVWDDIARRLTTPEARRAADNLRQLANLAAHQTPEARCSEALERALALGETILRGAGMPEAALMDGWRPETAAPDGPGSREAIVPVARSILPRRIPANDLLAPRGSAPAQLSWRLDEHADEFVLLEPGQRPYLIGRALDSDVLLDADLGVSRQHAQVVYDEGSWWLTDLGSKNGTRVGGLRASGRIRLADGVTLAVGSTDVRFELVG